MNAIAVVVSDWSEREASAFMDAEWPAHDAALGIRWESHDIVLVAKMDGEAVGAARGVVVGGLGSLNQILVKKERAHAGIGSSLLLEFERRCRVLACHKLRLETGDYQARPFYERHGFVLAATLRNDRFGRDFFIMEKAL
jgi:GNAT superfamily N-acetyltransferase